MVFLLHRRVIVMELYNSVIFLSTLVVLWDGVILCWRELCSRIKKSIRSGSPFKRYILPMRFISVYIQACAPISFKGVKAAFDGCLYMYPIL